VKEDKQNAGRWIELDETSSREKTRHAIRDYLLCKSKRQTKKKTTITKKKEEFMKKTAMKMNVSRSPEIHQISPSPSADAVDGSDPARTSPSAFMQFHQGAPMPAPALDEPGYPLMFTDTNGSSTHPIPLELKEVQGRYHTNSLEESLKISLSRYFNEDGHTTLSREGSYPRAPNAFLMQFHQEERMRVALVEPGYPLFTDTNSRSIHPINPKLKEVQGRYHTNSLEGLLTSSALMQFHQLALDEPGCPLFTHINGSGSSIHTVSL
jgi:hypothetical protein